MEHYYQPEIECASREEIVSGLGDAMKTLGMEIPEYLRLE